jgi:uncharacterized protein YbaR (Trm112 family)
MAHELNEIFCCPECKREYDYIEISQQKEKKKTNKTVWISSIIIAVILISIIVTSQINNRIDESDLPRFEQALLNDESVSKYVEFVSIHQDEESKHELEGYTFVDYIITGNVNSDYEMLNDQEKLSVLREMLLIILDEKDQV